MMLRTLTLAAAVFAAPALAQTAPTPGRQPLPAAPAATTPQPMGTVTAEPVAPDATPTAASTSIAQALPTLPNRATLNRLVTAADLGATLGGAGPFTVFAPTDEAFGRMPAGAIDTLLKPENKAVLATVLKYHVVAGRLTAEQIKAQITAGNGSATLTTVAGQTLTASLGENGNVLLTDVNGGKSYVEQADLVQANGVVHLTNGVVVPKLG